MQKMKLKKSEKADLEKKRVLFLQYGFILVLAILLYAFEWGSELRENSLLHQIQEVVTEEQIEVTRQQPETPPPPPNPVVTENFEIVSNEAVVTETEFESTEADENTIVNVEVFSNTEEEVAEEEPFIVVEEMPKFRGGTIDEFRNWIFKNTRYPDDAEKNGIQGKVYIRFVVNSQGDVIDVVVLKGVHPALDDEAVRVIKSSPKWTPGKQRGRAVPVQYTIPVVYTLQ